MYRRIQQIMCPKIQIYNFFVNETSIDFFHYISFLNTNCHIKRMMRWKYSEVPRESSVKAAEVTFTYTLMSIYQCHLLLESFTCLTVFMILIIFLPCTVIIFLLNKSCFLIIISLNDINKRIRERQVKMQNYIIFFNV